MAVKYFRAAGTNWTTDASWSTISSAGAADTVAPTASDDAILDAGSGNCTISATSVGKSLTCTGYTGTLTHNAFTLTISGSVTLVSGMTYTPSSATASVIVLNSTATLTTGGKLLAAVTMTGSNAYTMGDNWSFMAAKTCLVTLFNSGTQLNLNGKTLSGNSATDRVLVKTGTLGTASTIVNTTGTFANADFRDITFSSAADYSAITGLSGDCGGNTNATFTTAATQTYTGGTGSWSNSANWTSRVPLPQDDVLMSGVTGGTITADMPRLGKSIDWTGASGSPTFIVSVATTQYGSLTLISGMTFNSAGFQYTFEGRSASSITSSGKSFTSVVVFANVSATLSLNDAFITTSSISRTAGTFTTNNFNVSASQDNTGASGTTLNLGSSVYTLSRTASGTVFTGVATINAGTSTIFLTNTGANSTTFIGGGLTYNDLKLAGGGAGAVILTGANTFNRIYTDGGGTKSITLPGSTTTTLLSGAGLGNGTNVITFTASSGSATVSKASGILSWDYVNLTNIPSAGAAQFYAGANSTDGGGNTGWGFYSSTPELTDIGTGYRLPNSITLHNICLWLDGGGGTWADKVTKTFYTPTAMHQDVCIHDGKSMLFDGTASKIVCGDRSVSSTKLVKSVSFWAKPASTAGYFIDLNGTASVGMTANAITTSGWTSPTVYVNGVAQNSIQTSVWSFVTVTSATGLNASAVVLGLISSSYYSGAMTNITLMDKVLTADEHRWLYNTVRVGNTDLKNGLLDQGNLTFFKDYKTSQTSVNSDYSVGSATGTWTVTRSASTPATYVDSSGVIQIKTDTTPRFTQGFYDSTGFVSRPGLIVEGAGTNLNPYSIATAESGGKITNWGPTTGGTIGGTPTWSTTTPSIYPTAKAQRVQYTGIASDAGRLHLNLVTVAVTAGTTYTGSIWLKSQTGSGAQVSISIQELDGTATNVIQNITVTSSWARYQIQRVAGAGVTQARLTVGFVNGTPIVEGVVVDLEGCLPQLEASPFATTFIPTTTAALTRNAEKLTYLTASNRTVSTESIFIKTTPFWGASTSVASRILFDDDGSRRLFYFSNSDSKLHYASNVATAASEFSDTTTISAGTSYVFTGVSAGETASPNGLIYVNGSATTTDDDNYATNTLGTNFMVGERFTALSTTNWHGIISSIAIFSDAKAAANVSIISTLMTNS